MPYYVQSAYYPLPGAPRASAPQQQQPPPQQYAPQVDQVYLHQQAQAQQHAAHQQHQQQQQAYSQHQSQPQQLTPYQLEQLQLYAAQQDEYYRQQYAEQQAQQQREQAQLARELQQQHYLQQQHLQQRHHQQLQQQLQQEQARSAYHYQQQQAQPRTPLYKSSEYAPVGGAYGTGAPLSAPLRRAPSLADVNTAIENPEPSYQTYGQGVSAQEANYNPYVGYGQTVPQSPLRSQRSNTQLREPSQYAYDGLNPAVYGQQARQPLQRSYSPARQLPARSYSQERSRREVASSAREQPSNSNAWIGARSIAPAATTVLDANNNNNYAAASARARSPARGLPITPQKNYAAPPRNYAAPGALAESAYIGIPNDLVYAQSDAQRAYGYGQEQRPAYASSSRTNQTAQGNQQAYGGQEAQRPAYASSSRTNQLTPAAARQLYAALSSENVRTALEREPQYQQQKPAYASYNGQNVQGRAFVIPAEQKYSEYNMEDLNGLRSVIDLPLR